MYTSLSSSDSQILTSPLTPWYEPPHASAHHGELTQIVTGNVATTTKIADLQRALHLHGSSSQLQQWEALTQVAAIDVAVARMLEPHLDALGLLAEAGAESPVRDSTWGVYAAEHPDNVVTVDDAPGGPVINGRKAWCSLASELSHAIVIAHYGEHRQACAVELRVPQVDTEPGAWPSRGLQEIPSGSITFDQAPVELVGPVDWYLDRPTFAWGGIRVAACWFGGALGQARRAAWRHLERPNSSPIAAMTMGQLDAEIFTARTVLAQAATAADGEAQYTRDQAWSLALRVRNIIYRVVQRIQHLSRELAGPAALTGEAAFAKADADLTVYLSQHHGPRDEAALGVEFTTGIEDR